MPQVLVTPQAIYKIFRNLVIGHTGGSPEGNGFYVSRNIGPTLSPVVYPRPANTMPVKNLAYFKVGVGGPTAGEITKDFFETGVGAAETTGLAPGAGSGCLNRNAAGISTVDTRGDLNVPIHIFATAAEGWGGASRYKKALVAGDFYPYGTQPDSKVTGVLSVESGSSGFWWDIPGIAFQVACHLKPGEGNYDKDGVAVTSPDVVNINEVGVFDEDDVMVLYGVFPQTAKNPTLSFKGNLVAMLKALDYQLVVSV